MQTALTVLAALLTVTSVCCRADGASTRSTMKLVPAAQHGEPATLENVLALGQMLDFSMTTAERGVRTAEASRNLSAASRLEGIRIARERLGIVGKLLDLFEKDALSFHDDPRVRPYVTALPEYRRRLAGYAARLDGLSR